MKCSKPAFERRLSGSGYVPSLHSLIWLLMLGLTAQGQTPQRIISLAPNITEMVYRIGAGERLVGRTDYCLFPPDVAGVVSVGGYLDPDYETLVALEPDLVLMLPNRDRQDALTRLGLPTLTLPNETLGEIVSGLRRLGEELGQPEAAELAARGIEDTLRWISGQELDAKRSTLLVVGREPGGLKGLYAAGKETYLSEILALCGGTNIFSDVPLRYFDVSREDLISRNPDAILEFRIIETGDVAGTVAGLIDDWEVLPVIDAVRNGRIHIFTERYYLIPGPRIGRVAMSIYHALSRSSR